MIIVIGHLEVRPADRDRVVRLSADAVRQARDTAGCIDFAVSADPVDPGRVNVAERWRTRTDLARFRGAGPDDGLGELIRGYAIDEYELQEQE